LLAPAEGPASGVGVKVFPPVTVLSEQSNKVTKPEPEDDSHFTKVRRCSRYRQFCGSSRLWLTLSRENSWIACFCYSWWPSSFWISSSSAKIT